MDDRLKFQLDLVDNASGSANKAAQALYQLNVQLNQINQSHITFNSTIAKTTQGVDSFISKLHSGLWVAGRFVDVIGSITGAVAGLTTSFVESVVEQARFHNRSMVTLRAMFHGEPGRAEREFGAGIRLAQGLPGETADALLARQQLVSAGFKEQGTLDRAFGLQQDLVNLTAGRDAGTSPQITHLLNNLHGNGTVRAKDITNFETYGTGITRNSWFSEIAKARGIGGTELNQSDAIRKLISQNAIGGDEAIQALERAVTAHTGMDLGGFSHSLGSGLEAQVTNLQSLPTTLLSSWMNRGNQSTKSPAMQSFVEMIGKINKYFEIGTPTGEHFMQVLDKLINGVFVGLFSTDPTAMLDKIVNEFEKMIPTIKQVVEEIPKLIQAFVDFLPSLREAVPEFGKFVVSFAQLVEKLNSISWLFSMSQTRKMLGITGTESQTREGLSDVGLHLTGGPRIAAGTAEAPLPIYNSRSEFNAAPIVPLAQATTRLFETSQSLERVVGDRQNHRTIEAGAVNVAINFHLPEGSATDGPALAEATRPMIETSIAEALERLAIGSGVG